ncbi:MAG: chondroitinase-B domain-containing protein [bacterium]
MRTYDIIFFTIRVNEESVYRLFISCVVLIMLCVFIQGGVYGAEITVQGIAELNNAISHASAGDTIILADGTYRDQGGIDFDCRHITPAPSLGNEITVKAETPGGVVITGGSSSVTIMGPYLVFSGFHFRDIVENGIFMSLVNATYCRVTNCYFEGINKTGGVVEVRGLSADASVFYGSSTNNRIDHCIFDGNRRIEIENFIVDKEALVAPDTGNIHNRYDHNIFKNHIASSQEEAFQIGRGSTQWGDGSRGYPTEFKTDAYVTVEYNLFENYDGDNELVSSKSSSNSIRYNVVKNCDAGIKLRGGDDSVVEGNYFYWDRTEGKYYKGVSVNGTGHRVYNNYIETRTDSSDAIRLNAGNGGTIPDVADVVIANNVIKNAKYGVYFHSDGNPPINCTVMNNIAESPTAGGGTVMFNSVGTGHTFITNLAYCPSCKGGENGIDSNITSGVTNTGSYTLTSYDPGCGLAVCMYRPLLGEAADGTGTTIPYVIYDIDGQARDESAPDIGCDEISADPVSRLPVDETSAGVQWGADQDFVADIIIDNLDPEFATTGMWQPSGYPNPYATDSIYALTATTGVSATATWTPMILQSGMYEISVWWTSGNLRSYDAHYTITHAQGSSTKVVDHLQNGGQWNLLGTYRFEAGTEGYIMLSNDSQELERAVSADAVKLVYLTEVPGDLNRDGAIDIVDVQLCINVIIQTETGPEIINRSDVNGDSKKDVLDVQEIVNIVLLN